MFKAKATNENMMLFLKWRMAPWYSSKLGLWNIFLLISVNYDDYLIH